MFSRVRNVMEALLTQNNDGDIVKYVNELLPLLTLWGDKVSMLTHIYPHKPWRKIEVIIC